MTTYSRDYILEMNNITKEFPGVKALDKVNFKVKRGEIHCLVGENGAGKSTLMKVLSGLYPYGEYEGDIILNNEVQKYSGISDSEKAKIAIIYQELALIPEMSIYENIFLGHEIKNRYTITWNETIKKSKELLKKVNLNINPATKIKDLGVGGQQLVEIAKAFSKDVKLLILDEPTAALNENDSENLLNLIKELKGEGITSIMISHKLKEVISIADTVTVLRDGKTICSLDASKSEINEHTIIKNMVGREINDIYPKRARKEPGETVLEVKNWSAYSNDLGRSVLKNINFHVRKGEVVALAGLINVTKVTYFVFASMSMLAALAGVLYTSRLQSATTTAGLGFELDAIAAAYVGGVSTSGGVGKITGSLIGALVMSSLTSGMNLMGVNISYQYIIRGIILVIAVIFDVITRRKKG